MVIQRKHIVYIVLVFAALCVVYFVFVTLPRLGKVAVDITTHPEDAIVYINGNESPSGTVYLRPTQYDFSARKKGWETATATVTVSESNKTVALLPDPVSQEAIKEAEDPEVQALRESLAGIAAIARGNTLRNENPIINSLPYTDVSGPFKIDFGFEQEDKSTPYLIVSYSTPNGRQAATSWLKKKGVNLTKTEVIFSDFENPLSVKEVTH